MTSRWTRSAPAAWTRRTALPRLPRSESRMLAAIRARPVPMGRLPPCRFGGRDHPGRDRLVAPVAAQGGGTLPFQAVASSRHGRGGRLPGAFGRELATRRPDLLAAVPADRRRD